MLLRFRSFYAGAAAGSTLAACLPFFLKAPLSHRMSMRTGTNEPPMMAPIMPALLPSSAAAGGISGGGSDGGGGGGGISGGGSDSDGFGGGGDRTMKNPIDGVWAKPRGPCCRLDVYRERGSSLSKERNGSLRVCIIADLPVPPATCPCLPDDVHDPFAIRLAHPHTATHSFPARATDWFHAALRGQTAHGKAPELSCSCIDQRANCFVHEIRPFCAWISEPSSACRRYSRPHHDRPRADPELPLHRRSVAEPMRLS